MVYFHIKTADGREFVGSVQGFGGLLGGGAAHLGPEREKTVAIGELQNCIERLNESGRMVGVYEPKEAPGHCQVKSVYDWKVPHDGCFNFQIVPLKGATARLLTADEIRTIPPGTCRYDVPDPKAQDAAYLLKSRGQG